MSEARFDRISNENNTAGPIISGITTFSGQNYFVPPKGTTAERPSNCPVGSIRFNTDSAHLEYFDGLQWLELEAFNVELGVNGALGNRGVFAGNNPSPADGSGNTIEYITISTAGNTIDFGDRIGLGKRPIAATASSTRAVFAGSYGPVGNIIDYTTISSTGNAQDFGDCTTALTEATGISNSTRGVFAGGRTPANHNVIQYVTISSTGNAVDFGDLSDIRRNCGSFQSSTRGVIGAGRNNSNVDVNIIEYITISSTGNAVDFGDLVTASHGRETMGGGNATRGIFAGGNSPTTNVISFVTIASTGDAQDFGDNTAATGGMNTMASSSTRAVMFGSSIPARTLSYVTIQTTGNAISFGNLTVDATSNYYSGCSNGHGGL
jgi:hypothetical protein